MKVEKLRAGMAKDFMGKRVVHSRRRLTELFWLEYPVYCAKLLIKSPSSDRTAIETLEGILKFDELKAGHNTYVKP